MQKFMAIKFFFEGRYPLELVLLIASAIASAMIPSKKKQELVVQNRLPNNGHAVQSTLGGILSPLVPLTVSYRPGGNRSYTVTGLAGNEEDEASATSNDSDDGTLTEEMSWCTYNGTTTIGRENLDPVICDRVHLFF
jgi:hypothetical protein